MAMDWYSHVYVAILEMCLHCIGTSHYAYFIYYLCYTTAAVFIKFIYIYAQIMRIGHTYFHE